MALLCIQLDYVVVSGPLFFCLVCGLLDKASLPGKLTSESCTEDDILGLDLTSRMPQGQSSMDLWAGPGPWPGSRREMRKSSPCSYRQTSNKINYSKERFTP